MKGMDAGDQGVARHIPWLFPVAAFPETLDAVVQRTVLSGDLPARLVVYDSGNDWCVGDGSTTLTFRVRLSSRTRRV
jgi:hypothetical protein